MERGDVTEPRKYLVRHVESEPFLALADVPKPFEHDPRDEGYVCELISARKSASQDLRVGVCRLEPGQHHIKHHHPNGAEFYFFLKGECSLHVGGEESRARPGTSAYIPAGCVHGVLNDSEEDVEFLYGLNCGEYGQAGRVYDE